eukprot:Em0015g35a
MASGGRIHQLIKQARATFSRAANEATFRQEFEKLKAAMASVTFEDFNLSPSVLGKVWDYSPYVKDAPASCMDVYECTEFSVSIFMMKPNKYMPLHDHPEMHGTMKVLLGSMVVTAYSKPSSKAQGLLRCPLVPKIQLSPSSEPCCLYPSQANIHEIHTGDEPVAFLDILSPPYNPSQGRDCTYYAIKSADKTAKDEESSRSVWLQPIQIPSWFACVPQPYIGPPIIQ